ncbi:hypothetical protein HOI18_00205 [Candidatus Uhrbacteria bacterium]|nr:hypothetical protein [Candidatus Uhrbacteria bacterium]
MEMTRAQIELYESSEFYARDEYGGFEEFDDYHPDDQHPECDPSWTREKDWSESVGDSDPDDGPVEDVANSPGVYWSDW